MLGALPSTAGPANAKRSGPQSNPKPRSARRREAHARVRLNYVLDDTPGIVRRKIRGHWAYFLPDGSSLRDLSEIKRINALVIPPAYTAVWICMDPLGHLQATGRDARGRKQYRYHPAWRQMRDANKYDRMLAFSRALPRIRERVEHDLALSGMPRERVLATLVRLLETTLIRVGNEAYAQSNESYGLTTLQNDHVDIHGANLSFRFRGKSGVEHDITIRDARLARIVKRCADIPGHELFQYLDEQGGRHKIGSGDVNEYLRNALAGSAQATDDDSSFTAKDFRTWAGSVMALNFLSREPPVDTESARKRNVVAIVEMVAERLGNTPAVCRRCYIHPAIPQAYMDGKLPPDDTTENVTAHSPGLNDDEARLQAFLGALVADADGGVHR